VANPEGEHFTKNTSFLDNLQIDDMINQLQATKSLPIHIEHLLENTDGRPILASGETIGAKWDKKTNGFGVYFALYDSENGHIAFDAITRGSLTGGMKLQQLSIGNMFERLLKDPVALSNNVYEISIVKQGDRPNTKIRGYTCTKPDAPAEFIEFD
jgi:hypothetical protein